MLLAGCSTVCTTVAEAAKMWNLVVVSVDKICYLNKQIRKENRLVSSLVVLRCVISCVVGSKSVPDAFQDTPLSHGAQSHEN